jgi:cytochrome c553
MRTSTFIALIGFAVAAGNVHGDGDPAAGQAKAAACAACHGADGNSANPDWPKLAGQHPGYTEKQLKDFKAGRRANPMMAGMAAPLSETDIADIAAYYATMTRSGGFASEARVVLGKSIFRGGNDRRGVPACMACHGPAGAGDPLGAIPALSGQHAKYVAAQLYAYREGERSNDPRGMMREAVRWMTKEEIEAVSEYIAGLH